MSIRIERRWALWGVLAVVAAWLVAAGAAALTGSAPPDTATGYAGFAAAVLPPIGLALLVFGLLAATEPPAALAEVETRLAEARGEVAALQDQLESVDALLARSIERTMLLTSTASQQLPALDESAAALEAVANRVVDAGDATQRIVSGFTGALPALEATIAQVDATLRSVSSDCATQLRAVETMLGQVQGRNRQAAIDADAAIGAMTVLLSSIDEASARNTQTLSKRAYALDAAIDGVLERTTAAVDGIRDRVTVQLQAIHGGVDGAGKRLILFGDDSTRLLNQRIELLLRTYDSLHSQFAAHEAGSTRLQALIAGQIESLGERFAGLGTTAGATIGELGDRLAAVSQRLTALDAPLSASGTAMAGIEASTAKLDTVVAAFEAAMRERLSATQTSIAMLESDAERLSATIGALGDAASHGSALVSGAATALTSEHDSIEALAAALAGHFEAARDRLAALEASHGAAATAMSEGVGTEIARIMAAGETAADTIQRRIAAVIDGAMATLAATATERVEAAFGRPVEAQLAAIEAAAGRAADAGDAAAERMATQIQSVIDTIDVVVARVDESGAGDGKTMAAKSMRLIEQLNDAIIDVAGMLAVRVGEPEWAAYLAGDRGVFARAVAPQLDRETARQMAQLWRDDPEFADHATRFCAQFDKLLQRLMGDADGEALAATMLSSDIGKIYVAIADADGRLPPQQAPS